MTRTSASFSILIILLLGACHSSNTALTGDNSIFTDVSASDDDMEALFAHRLSEITGNRVDFSGSVAEQIAKLATFDLSPIAEDAIADPAELKRRIAEEFAQHEADFADKNYAPFVAKASELAKRHMIAYMIKHKTSIYDLGTSVDKVFSNAFSVVTEKPIFRQTTEQRNLFSKNEMTEIINLLTQNYRELDLFFVNQNFVVQSIDTEVIPNLVGEALQTKDQTTMDNLAERLRTLLNLVKVSDRFVSLSEALNQNEDFQLLTDPNQQSPVSPLLSDLLAKVFSSVINSKLGPKYTKTSMIRDLLMMHFNEALEFGSKPEIDPETDNEVRPPIKFPIKIHMCETILKDLASNGWNFIKAGDSSSDRLFKQIHLSLISYCSIVDEHYLFTDDQINGLFNHIDQLLTVPQDVWKYLHKLPTILYNDNLNLSKDNELSMNLLQLLKRTIVADMEKSEESKLAALTESIENSSDKDNTVSILTEMDILEKLDDIVSEYNNGIFEKNSAAPIDLENYYITMKFLLSMGERSEDFSLDFSNVSDPSFDKLFEQFAANHEKPGKTLPILEKYINALFHKAFALSASDPIRIRVDRLRREVIPGDVITSSLVKDKRSSEDSEFNNA